MFAGQVDCRKRVAVAILAAEDDINSHKESQHESWIFLWWLAAVSLGAGFTNQTHATINATTPAFFPLLAGHASPVSHRHHRDSNKRNPKTDFLADDSASAELTGTDETVNLIRRKTRTLL